MEDALDRARRTLAPTEAEALDAWRLLVRADSDQVEALPRRPNPSDFYAPVAESFRADPRRAGDPVLEHLRSLIEPGATWLDLGAGGGRYTLPIALRAAHVYAVEPSEGMRAVLASAMAEGLISNVSIYPERWPGPSEAPVADIGFMSHVSYDIEDIGPFLTQLEAHARRYCLAVLFERAPISDFAPLWEPVHGEPRSLLPGLREFVALLFARGRVPEVQVFEVAQRSFPDVETLHRAARRPLWVLEGSEEDRRLGGAVRSMAHRIEGGVVLSTRRRVVGVVTWRPEPAG